MVRHVRSLPPQELEFQMFVLDELADAARRRGEDVIKLTIGITDLPAPDRVLDALVAMARDPEVARLVYPEGLPELREAIARYYRQEYGAPADPEHVIVHTGTSPIFRNLFQLLCQPGQEVLLPRPYYCLYKICALLAGARVAYYDLDLETGRVDPASFRRAFDPDARPSSSSTAPVIRSATSCAVTRCWRSTRSSPRGPTSSATRSTATAASTSRSPARWRTCRSRRGA